MLAVRRPVARRTLLNSQHTLLHPSHIRVGHLITARAPRFRYSNSSVREQCQIQTRSLSVSSSSSFSYRQSHRQQQRPSLPNPLRTRRPVPLDVAMATLESITKSLAELSITPAATISHEPTSSPAAWREALEANSNAPKSFELVKALLYKPKTAKTAIPIPLVVIAREGTEVNSGLIGKKLGLKELRFASEDQIGRAHV